MVKSGARVLDATASNRSIWRTKESRHVLYIDIEPELEIPPDMVLDCTSTGFEPGRFHTIFFDPPHWWGAIPGENYYTCRNRKEFIEFKKRRGGLEPSRAYYGNDKFRNKTELLVFIHKAQREFNRILMDDGILWVKWNEMEIPLSRILPFFRNWEEMMRIEVARQVQSMGSQRTYWIMFMKKDGLLQAELDAVGR